MHLRLLVLLVLVVLPSLGFMGGSAFYLFPDWVALTAAQRQYAELVIAGASERDLAIAQAAENRHRINCFAEGVGVLLGGIMFAIGIHGICTLPQRPT